MSLIGRTLEWDGWYFSFLQHRIEIWHPRADRHLQIQWPQHQNTVAVMNYLGDLMSLANMGAQMRGNTIRSALGIPENGVDTLFNPGISKMERIIDCSKYKLIPWED